MTTMYYVNFEGTSADKKGPVQAADFKGFYPVDGISDHEAYQSTGGSYHGNSYNKKILGSMSFSPVMMHTSDNAAIGYLMQMQANATVIKKLVIVRVATGEKGALVKEEEREYEDVVIESVSSSGAVAFNSYSAFVITTYITDQTGKVTTFRTGLNLNEAKMTDS